MKLLEKKDTRPQKDDLVSPEPIPRKEETISQTPLLTDVKKGKLLLDDDMKKNKHLSPNKSTGDAYSGGRLHLNATHLDKYHAYVFYGAPLDNAENFIFEGKVKVRVTYAGKSPYKWEILFDEGIDWKVLRLTGLLFYNYLGKRKTIEKVNRIII